MKNINDFFTEEKHVVHADQTRLFTVESSMVMPKIYPCSRSEIQRWYDLHFCNFFPNGNHPAPESIEYELGRRLWLQDSSNEGEYNTRLMLVCEVWSKTQEAAQVLQTRWEQYHAAALDDKERSYNFAAHQAKQSYDKEITALRTQLECTQRERDKFKGKFIAAHLFIQRISRSFCCSKSMRKRAAKLWKEITRD